MPPKKKDLHDDATRRQFEKHFRKVEPTLEQMAQGMSGCWLWQDRKDADGYGQFRWNGDLYRAHRFSYLLYVEEPESGMDVDHKCNNYACVNPEHLQVVLHVVNMRLQKERAADHNPGLAILTPKRDLTTAELVLSWCTEAMRQRKWTPPETYGVISMQDAPWRAYENFEDKALEPNVPLSLLALYLYAVSMGCPSYQTARTILELGDYQLTRWNANPDWKTDTENARRAGRQARAVNLRETIEETLISRLPFADIKDVVRGYEIMTRNEEARAERKHKKTHPELGGGNQYVFILKAPEDQHAAIAEQIYEGVVRDVTEDDRPALPPPDDWDENFEDE